MANWSGIWGGGLSLLYCATIFMSGSSRTAEGTKAFEARLLSSSWISLWRKITSSPFLQLRACCTLDFCEQPSHCEGRPGGVLAYLSRRASRNSWEESSVPLMVDGITVSQILVDLPLRIVLCSLQGNWAAIAPRLDSAVAVEERSLSSRRTARMTSKWSADLKSSTPRRAASKWEHIKMLASCMLLRTGWGLEGPVRRTSLGFDLVWPTVSTRTVRSYRNLQSVLLVPKRVSLINSILALD
jgi:hypothetical protein